ncbi:MAG: hypothetical protein ACHQVK_03235, partial [Candidatus Paceibacterales bacterium]
KLVETLVHRAVLTNNQHDVLYWQGNGEIDLVLRRGLTVTDLIQAVYSGLDDAKVLQRELAALHEAGMQFPQAKKWLLTFDNPKQLPGEIPKDVQFLPLWHYLLLDINRR